MGKKNIYAFSVDNPDEGRLRMSCKFNEVTECPSCHFAIEPKQLCAFYVQHDSINHTMYLLCLCKRCQQVFMSEFKGRLNSCFLEFSSPEYSVPCKPNGNVFSNPIRNLSPNFVETYTQAEIAESYHLFQICGVGYRKSLEYLVKDYLCHKTPENSDKIYSEFLGANIKRIDDPRIKVLAERSVWIGNDETHYVRKHDDLCLSDMKRFINAMLHYVESELAFEEAEAISSK